jgi:hypothetical protein
MDITLADEVETSLLPEGASLGEGGIVSFVDPEFHYAADLDLLLFPEDLTNPDGC